MGRRDRVGLVPAEGVELHRVELALLVVGLVDRDDDRRRRTAKQLGGLRIGWRHAGRRVDDEDDDVGLGDGQACLLLDPSLDRVVGIELQPAGIDDDEAPGVPLGVAIQAVPGRARAVLDDGRAPTDDAVEQGALADVRAAHDGHDR